MFNSPSDPTEIKINSLEMTRKRITAMIFMLIMTAMVVTKAPGELKGVSYWKEGVEVPKYDRISKLDIPSINLVDVTNSTLSIDTDIQGDPQFFNPAISEIYQLNKKISIENLISGETIDFRNCKKVFRLFDSKSNFALLCGNMGLDLVVIDYNPASLDRIQIVAKQRIDGFDSCGAVDAALGINKNGRAVEKVYAVCKKSDNEGKISVNVVLFLLTGDKLYFQSTKSVEQEGNIGLDYDLRLISYDKGVRKNLQFLLRRRESRDFVAYRVTDQEDNLSIEYLNVESPKIKNWPLADSSRGLIDVYVLKEKIVLIFEEKTQGESGSEFMVSVSSSFTEDGGLIFASPATIFKTSRASLESKIKTDVLEKSNPENSLQSFRVAVLSLEGKLSLFDFAIQPIGDTTLLLVDISEKHQKVDDLMSVVDRVYLVGDKLVILGESRMKTFFIENSHSGKNVRIVHGDVRNFIVQLSKRKSSEVVVMNFLLTKEEILEIYTINDPVLTFPGLSNIGETMQEDFVEANVTLFARNGQTQERGEARKIQFKVLSKRYGRRIVNSRSSILEGNTDTALAFGSWNGDFEGNEKSFKAYLSYGKVKGGKRVLQAPNVYAEVSYKGEFTLESLGIDDFDFKKIDKVVSQASNTFTVDVSGSTMFFNCYEGSGDTFTNKIFCSRMEESKKARPGSADLVTGTLIDSAYYSDEKFKIFMNCYQKPSNVDPTSPNRSFIITRYSKTEDDETKTGDSYTQIDDWIEDCTIKVDKRGNFRIYAAVRARGVKSQGSANVDMINLNNRILVGELIKGDNMGKPLMTPVRNLDRARVCPYRVKLVEDRIVVLSVCVYITNQINKVLRTSSVVIYKHSRDSRDPDLDDISSLIPEKVIDLDQYNWESPDICVTKDYVHVFEMSQAATKRLDAPFIRSFSLNGHHFNRVNLLNGQSEYRIKTILDFSCDVKRQGVSVLALRQNSKGKMVINFDINNIKNANNRIHSVENLAIDIDFISQIHLHKQDKIVNIGFKEQGNELKCLYFDLDGPTFVFDQKFINEEGERTLNIEFGGYGNSRILTKNLTVNLTKFNTGGELILKEGIVKRVADDHPQFELGAFLDFKGGIFNIEYKGDDKEKNTVKQFLEKNDKFWKMDFSGYKDWELLEFDILGDYAITVLRDQKNPTSPTAEIMMFKNQNDPKMLFKFSRTDLEMIKVEIVASTADSIFAFVLSSEKITRVKVVTVIYKQAKNNEWKYFDFIDKENRYLEEGMENAEIYHMSNQPQSDLAAPRFSMIWVDNTEIPHMAYLNFEINFRSETPKLAFLSEKKKILFGKTINDYSISYSQDMIPSQSSVGRNNMDAAGAILTVVVGNYKEVEFFALTIDDDGLLEFPGDKYRKVSPVMDEGEQGAYSFRNLKLSCMRTLQKVASGAKGYQNYCFLALEGEFSVSFYIVIDQMRVIKESGLELKEVVFEQKYQNVLNYIPIRVLRSYDSMVGIYEKLPEGGKITNSTILNENFLIVFWRQFEGTSPVGVIKGSDVGGGYGQSMNLEVLRVRDGDKSKLVLFLNRATSLKSASKRQELAQSNAVTKIESFTLNVGYVFKIGNVKKLSVSQDEFVIQSYKDEKIPLKLQSFFSQKFDPKAEDKPDTGRWELWQVLLLVVFLAGVAGLGAWFVYNKNRKGGIYDEENTMEVDDEMSLGVNDYSRL